jgi:hypothetical protein
MAVAWSWAFDTPFKWTKLIGKSLLSVGGAASRRSQHLEMKCDRVSADTGPTELRIALTSNTEKHTPRLDGARPGSPYDALAPALPARAT